MSGLENVHIPVEDILQNSQNESLNCAQCTRKLFEIRDWHVK